MSLEQQRILEQQVKLGLLARQDPKVFLDQQQLLELQAQQVKLDPQVIQVPKVNLEQQPILAQLDPLAKLELLSMLEQAHLT